MMDAAGENPQLAHPEKVPRVDGETLRHSPTEIFSVTKVLDDDNLLREIIVHTGFPTTLVRAALVCKRWLGHASDPKFLSRFRKLHPPRILGYYITDRWVLSPVPDAPRFVPMLPQSTELTAVIRRVASYKFGAHEIMQCQNGSVFTKCFEDNRWTHGLHRPLFAEKGMQIVPSLLHTQHHSRKNFHAIVSKEEGNGVPHAQHPSCQNIHAIISEEEGNRVSYLYVSGEPTGESGKSTTRVYVLLDGVWGMRTLARYLCGELHLCPDTLLVDNKIYMLAASGNDITVLDFTHSTFSTIQLPQGMKYHDYKSMLSRADDASSVYLIHVEDFQLRVWLHKGDNWLLVDTICLHETLAILGMPEHMLEDEDIANVKIIQVGDNAQFVFLWIAQCVFYLDIKCRRPCQVYEDTFDRRFGNVHPVMMMWPPIFPAHKDDHSRFAFSC